MDKFETKLVNETGSEKLSRWVFFDTKGNKYVTETIYSSASEALRSEEEFFSVHMEKKFSMRRFGEFE